MRAGQLVLAFGSPLGLNNSVSLGVVSAVARRLEPESPMVYVQTDASINPGSSGGPLVDLRGRIVGINTLILSQAGGSEGLGFTAPSHIVRRDEQQHHERYAHPREVKHSEPRCHRNAGGEDDGRGCNLPSQTSSADCRPPLRPAKCRRPAERVDGGSL